MTRVCALPTFSSVQVPGAVGAVRALSGGPSYAFLCVWPASL
ncbi:MAG: hypothetical protein AAGF12_09620 [Myxococcota bacterium]